ncbi:hypothetical protein CRE_06387 [Caenorhabditis remanei]|uniref:Uncharacterized protein n=1 Tax=Caenorhabditis remanei TaxID=31234 RepID=E3M1W9_CAERE|nr:hypothetical protein CRE_06387 [Caenorhabditis remanei]
MYLFPGMRLQVLSFSDCSVLMRFAASHGQHRQNVTTKKRILISPPTHRRLIVQYIAGKEMKFKKVGKR